MSHELLISSIKLAEAISDLPSGFDLRFKCLDKRYQQLIDISKNHVYGLLSTLISSINSENIQVDQFTIDTEVDTAITSFLDSIPIDIFQDRSSIPPPIVSEPEEKTYDNFKFICSKNVQKPIKFPSPLTVPESVDTISNLPQIENFQSQIPTDVPVVTTAAVFKRICNQLSSSPALFFNLEIHRIRTFFPFAPVISICTSNMDIFIIDVLSLRNDLSPLQNLLESSIPKIFFDADASLPVLSQTFSIFPTHVISLKFFFKTNLFEILKDNGISVDSYLVDWRIRPLSKTMISIAKHDVAYLPLLYSKMKENFTEDEIIEKNQIFGCPKLLNIPDSQQIVENLLKKYGTLDEIGIKRLKVVVEWRTSIAISEDESLSYVLSDEATYLIAKNQPNNASELKTLCQNSISNLALASLQELFLKLYSNFDRLNIFT